MRLNLKPVIIEATRLQLAPAGATRVANLLLESCSRPIKTMRPSFKWMPRRWAVAFPAQTRRGPEKSILPFILSLAAWFMTTVPGKCANEKLEESARTFAAKARQEVKQGAFESAIDHWKSAIASYRKAQCGSELIDAILQLGTNYHSLGQQQLALKTFNEALELARAKGDRQQTIAALSNLGAVRRFSRNPDEAEKDLQEALQLARAGADSAGTSSVLNHLGNLKAAAGRMEQAIQSYREAIKLAEVGGEKALAATARANLADATWRSGSYDQAAKLNADALKAAAALADSHDKAFDLLHGGKTWERIFEKGPAHDAQSRVRALHAYEAAARTATAIGDDRALSFALGYAGHLYEEEKKMDDALRLTTRAAFLAQRLRSPDILYQWEWQTGRILRAQGRLDEAIDADRRAVDLLETIRTDLSAHLGSSEGHSSYRGAVGDVYFELADLLLLRADAQRDQTDLEKTLRQAREVCEQLKSVELEDYFQDGCVNLIRKKKETVDDLLRRTSGKKDAKEHGGDVGEFLQKTAVVYFVPLRDRTETIVSLSDGLHRVKVPVGVDQLTAVVRDFRLHLETRTTNEYLTEAWQLYDWLIRPLEPLLMANKIDTLVFVPDGSLRTIPMAAFHDREKFLVEKYAIAVTPGLTLMEPHPMNHGSPSLMTSGLSEAVQGYPALPFVLPEIASLQDRFHGRTLLNRDFLVSKVQEEFKGREYSIVHIASHAEFSNDVRKTFVLTYDDRLSLDMIERMIRPAQLRDKPVEMLTLSACQTAAGDDRAALGLAGVAVKAGARSAFATLWFVNDEASTTLVSEFYADLFDAKHPSKAQALRNAQIKLLSDPRYSHPCLWAPYLIIGNWL